MLGQAAVGGNQAKTEPPMLAVLLAVALVALASGCAPPEPPPPILQPVLRLTGLTAKPPQPWQPARCAVDDEFRPSFGCMPVRLVKAEIQTDPKVPDRTRMVLSTPKAQVGKALAIVPSLRAGPNRSPTRLGARILEAAPAKLAIELDFDPARLREKSVAQMSLTPLPPARRRVATLPVRLPEGAQLRVGLALRDIAKELHLGSTQFRIDAQWDGGQRELLFEEIPGKSAGMWHDRQIDLADLLTAAGDQKVTFQFTTIAPPIAEGQSVAASFPIWGAPEILAKEERDGRLNVVLISLDTVRADYMGGEHRGVQLTPWFDQLTEQGTIFRQAVTTFSSTSASHMSLFTGTYPAEHNVRHAVHQLPAKIRTLPEVLRQHGYATGAVTENAMLLAGSGFSRGFDSYRENTDSLKHTGSIDRTFGQGVEWLEKHRNELFFLFLHTYEAHSPYAPKEEALAAIPEIDPDAEGLTPADAGWERSKRSYAAEVLYTDEGLERLFGELRRLDLLDHTLIVITSDHGEEFGEHGRLGHAKTVFEEVLRIPLLLWRPGTIPSGREVDDVVSLVDVAPTILDLAGISPPPAIPGRSLVSAIHGDPLDVTSVRFAEGLQNNVRMVAARMPTRKWIWHDDGRPLEFYDLEKDPGETSPVPDQENLAFGKALIEAYLTQDETETKKKTTTTENPSETPKKRVLDQTTRQKLEALGYVE